MLCVDGTCFMITDFRLWSFGVILGSCCNNTSVWWSHRWYLCLYQKLWNYATRWMSFQSTPNQRSLQSLQAIEQTRTKVLPILSKVYVIQHKSAHTLRVYNFRTLCIQYRDVRTSFFLLQSFVVRHTKDPLPNILFAHLYILVAPNAERAKSIE